MTEETSWPSAPGAETLSPPLSSADLHAFAGAEATISPLMRSVDYYVPRWSAMLSQQSRNGGFNWAAAFFGMAWCCWRKLYALAAVILLAELVSTLLVVSIFTQGFGGEPSPETIGLQAWIATLPVRFLLGAHANSLYLGQAIRAVNEARQTHASAEAQHSYLATRGRTSWLALGVLFGIRIALFATSGI